MAAILGVLLLWAVAGVRRHRRDRSSWQVAKPVYLVALVLPLCERLAEAARFLLTAVPVDVTRPVLREVLLLHLWETIFYGIPFFVFARAVAKRDPLGATFRQRLRDEAAPATLAILAVPYAVGFLFVGWSLNTDQRLDGGQGTAMFMGWIVIPAACALASLRWWFATRAR